MVTKQFAIVDGGPDGAGKASSASDGTASPKTSGAYLSSSFSMSKTGDEFLLVLCGVTLIALMGAGSIALAKSRDKR